MDSKSPYSSFESDALRTTRAIQSVIVSMLILMTGCATTRGLFVAEPAPPPGESVVYIYRPAASAMQGMTAVVEIDGRKAAELYNNSYTVVHVREGDHQVSQFWKNMTFYENNKPLRNRTDLFIHATPGRQYYFRAAASGEVGPEGVIQLIQTGWTFDEVSQRTALAEIVKCRLEISKR